MALQVEVVSAEHEVFSGEADYVIAPAFGGDVGIYPNHAPLLTLLKPGEVRLGYKNKEKQEQCFYVSGGFLEVQPDMVSILADVSERGEDLDEQAVLEAEKRAKEILAGKGVDGKIDYNAALNTLAQASAQLRLIKRLRQTK